MVIRKLVAIFAPLTLFEVIACYRETTDNGVLIIPLISHSEVLRRRRNLVNLPDPTNADPLYQGIGTHYVDLWIGCPEPQRQTVVVDTGSGITGIPCNVR